MIFSDAIDGGSRGEALSRTQEMPLIVSEFGQACSSTCPDCAVSVLEEGEDESSREPVLGCGVYESAVLDSRHASSAAKAEPQGIIAGHHQRVNCVGRQWWLAVRSPCGELCSIKSDKT